MNRIVFTFVSRSLYFRTVFYLVFYLFRFTSPVTGAYKSLGKRMLNESVVHSFLYVFQLAIAECYGIEALIRLLKRTRRDEVRKHDAI